MCFATHEFQRKFGTNDSQRYQWNCTHVCMLIPINCILLDFWIVCSSCKVSTVCNFGVKISSTQSELIHLPCITQHAYHADDGFCESIILLCGHYCISLLLFHVTRLGWWYSNFKFHNLMLKAFQVSSLLHSLCLQ